MTHLPRKLFHIFPTFAVGGSQVRLAQVANHFGDRYDHTVFATDGVYEALSLVRAPAKMRQFEAVIDKRRGLRNMPIYLRAMRDIGADVVVTHNWGAIEWAFATRFARRLRHIHIEDGFGPDEAKRQLLRRVLFRRVALSGARSTVVVPSTTLLDVATRVWRLPPARVLFIPNGINLGRFAGAAGEARGADMPPDAVLIGTVASLRPEKNLELLIQAFAMLPDENARLVIVGTGSEMQALRSFADGTTAAHRITFAGHASQPEKILRTLDIFAMSSNTEQMPISLLEAMACGLPVAATGVGDIAQMVADDNRDLIVPAGDLNALTQALARLVRNRDLRQRVGAQNLARVSAAYDEPAMFSRYAALFDQPL